MPSGLVLLSGGLDSAVALGWALKHSPDVTAIHFSYGQDAEASEARAALDLAEHYRIPLLMRPLLMPEARASCPAHSFYAPGRNLMMLAYADSVCETIGIDHLVIGAHADDLKNGCTCKRTEVLRAWIINTPGYVIAPLLNLSKAEVVALGRQLEVPLGATWSCYERGPEPCHECNSCRERELAVR